MTQSSHCRRHPVFWFSFSWVNNGASLDHSCEVPISFSRTTVLYLGRPTSWTFDSTGTKNCLGDCPVILTFNRRSRGSSGSILRPKARNVWLRVCLHASVRFFCQYHMTYALHLFALWILTNGCRLTILFSGAHYACNDRSAQKLSKTLPDRTVCCSSASTTVVPPKLVPYGHQASLDASRDQRVHYYAVQSALLPP